MHDYIFYLILLSLANYHILMALMALIFKLSIIYAIYQIGGKGTEME